MDDATRFPPNELLKAHRKRRCWSQEDLAEKVGTSSKNVGRWERGVTSPSPYYCQKLCEVFGVSPWELGLIQQDPLAGVDINSVRDRISQPGSINEEASEGDRPPIGSSATRFPTPDSGRQGLHFPGIFLPKRTSWRVALAVLCLLVVIAGFFGLSKYALNLAHIKPGGAWISPMDRQMVSGVVHFSAYAYPTNPGDPAIDYVNFTAWWQRVDPRKWNIVCRVHDHSSKDVFSCDVDLAQLGALAGPIRISFDVYDQNGNYNMAPNGVHMITYSP